MAATIRPLPTAQPARPFDARLSTTLDLLIIQLEANPPRWKRQILRLRKRGAERRALGRAGR